MSGNKGDKVYPVADGKEAERQNTILRAINSIYEQSALFNTAGEAGTACLDIVESALQSKISFINEISEDGLLLEAAVSSSSKRDCRIPLGNGHVELFRSFRIQGLYKSVILEGKSLLANDPANHPDSMGPPEGHIILHSFLCVPFFSEGKTSGILAVANKDGGYNEQDKETLEALAPTVFEVLLRKRAEEALHGNEEKYRELIKSSPAGIYEVDFRTKRFTSVNDAMCIITGYSREEILGMSPFDILDGQSRIKFRKRIEQWLSGEKPEDNVDYKVITKDGREIYALLNVKFTKDVNGTPLGASVVAYDITERKKAEYEINRQNTILQMINRVYEKSVSCATVQELGRECLDMIRMAVGNKAGFIGEVGADGALHDIAFSLGTEVSTIPENIADHRRINGAGVVGLYRSVIENAKTILSNDPANHPHSTGTPEGHFRINSFLGVPFARNGNILGLIGIANKEGGFGEDDRRILEAVTPSVLEVLLHKRAEQALKESEKRQTFLLRLSDAIKNLNDIKEIQGITARMVGELMSVDRAGYGTMVRENGRGCFLIGSDYHTPGMPDLCGICFPVDDYGPAVVNTIHSGQTLAVGDIEKDERFTREEKEAFRAVGIRAVVNVPLLREGKCVANFGLQQKQPRKWTHDELKLLEETVARTWAAVERAKAEEALRESEEKALALVKELEEADRNKNRFISTLSHELRNPLASISLGIQLLSSTKDKNKTEHAKEIMNRQITQLCRLVDDLLDLTRINNNKIILKEERTDINSLLRITAEDCRHAFKDKGVRLETQIEDSPFMIDVDPVRIRQIAENLLGNALKFTETGGKTVLSVLRENENAVICVEDNGLGIKPELLRKLFQPFMQADTSLDRSAGGLGLGLAVSKGIAELHGGSVSAYSEGPGKGSKFCICLPIIQKEAEKEGNESTADKKAKPLKMLLIEDNRDYSELLGTTLKMAGHEVVLAFDGAEGIEKAKQTAYDAIICDIGLPHINGYEVARAIRSIQKDVFLIALTGYVESQSIERAREAGFNRHISKPADINILNAILSCVSPADNTD